MNMPSYPVLDLTKDSSEQDQMDAMNATIQQLIQEGKTPEEAQSIAVRLFKQKMEMPLEFQGMNKMVDYSKGFTNPQSAFARGDSTGPSGNGIPSAMNPVLNNFRPSFRPTGPMQNK